MTLRRSVAAIMLAPFLAALTSGCGTIIHGRSQDVLVTSVPSGATAKVGDVQVDNFDALITLPQVFVARGTVDVAGTAQTKNGLAFSSYKLEWGAGTSPTSFSTAGITPSIARISPPGTIGRCGTAALQLLLLFS